MVRKVLLSTPCNPSSSSLLVPVLPLQEHAYYASFGYHVTNPFAISSRCALWQAGMLLLLLIACLQSCDEDGRCLAQSTPAYSKSRRYMCKVHPRTGACR
jgi:hypothetical protein